MRAIEHEEGVWILRLSMVVNEGVEDAPYRADTNKEDRPLNNKLLAEGVWAMEGPKLYRMVSKQGQTEMTRTHA